MTAQTGEKLIFSGKETWMAAEPLNKYLLNRDDINFIWPSTDCYRGYYGEWEIKDNKLYLIGLKAYLEGYREVGLDYLFPGQKEVFASWVNGKIRVPQGEKLEHVHAAYLSTYESDLFLVFEKGILVNQYEVNNVKEYLDRLKRRKKERKKKKINEIIGFSVFLFFILVFIGICVGIFYLIKRGSVLGYVILAILASGILFLFFLAIKNRIRDKREAAKMKK